MTLQQLTYFLAAARCGSFSRAAEELFLTQPGVSDQVRKLEAELGMPLFTRVGRGLVLTSAGEAFRPHAEQVLMGAERAVDSVAEIRNLRGGQITFGLFRNADYSILPDLVAEFHARHPLVRLRLLGQNSGETAEDVRNGRIEAGLVAGPVDPAGLSVTPLAADELLYVTRDEELAAEPISIEQMLDRPLVLYDAQFAWQDTTRRQLEEWAQSLGRRLEPVVDLEHIEGALQLAAAGIGATVATRAVTRSSIFPQGLHTTSFAVPIKDPYVFLTRRDTPLTPPLRELAELAETLLLRYCEPLQKGARPGRISLAIRG